jgi:hypothetical protein
MLVVSLSQKVSLFIVLSLIVLIIDNGNCDRDNNANPIHTHHYPPQFRASHSPPYEFIYIPGKKKVFNLFVKSLNSN